MVETEHREVDLLGGQQVDQLRDPEREDGVHVVLQLPTLEDWRMCARIAARKWSRYGLKSSYEMTKTRSDGLAWLKASNSAAACSRRAVLPLPFSPKTSAVDGSAGLPKNLFQAGWWIVKRHSPEDRVGLSILLAEWVALDAMMLQELFRLHPWGGLSVRSRNRIHSVFVSRSHSTCLTRFGVPPQSQAVDASLVQVVGCTLSIANTRETKARKGSYPDVPIDHSWRSLGTRSGCIDRRRMRSRSTCRRPATSDRGRLRLATRLASTDRAVSKPDSNDRDPDPDIRRLGPACRTDQGWAPFDLFLSANVKFVSDLAAAGLVEPASVQPYARGSLVLCLHRAAGDQVRGLADLSRPEIKRIAIANPDTRLTVWPPGRRSSAPGSGPAWNPRSCAPIRYAKP